MALWDLTGQAAGMPLYTLLGGRHVADMPLYHSITCIAPDEMARIAREAHGAGMRQFQVKLGASGDWQVDVERLTKVREAVGAGGGQTRLLRQLEAQLPGGMPAQARHQPRGADRASVDLLIFGFSVPAGSTITTQSWNLSWKSCTSNSVPLPRISRTAPRAKMSVLWSTSSMFPSACSGDI